MENIFTFYINFNSDSMDGVVEFKLNSNLFVGDLLNFADHNLREEFIEYFNTTMFVITQRIFSMEFNEMQLEVKPYYE